MHQVLLLGLVQFPGLLLLVLLAEHEYQIIFQNLAQEERVFTLHYYMKMDRMLVLGQLRQGQRSKWHDR